MSKKLVIGLALVTLIVFPVPAFVARYYLNDVSPIELLDLAGFHWQKILLGLEVGIGFAFLSMILLRSSVFDNIPMQIEKVIKDMKLSIPEGLFISFCAGFGEEILFRAGVQFYLGEIITSILFIAVHGYFSISSPRNSLYGFILLPFVLVLSFGFEGFGLWFAIAAHFAYDAVLFTTIIRDQRINAE